MKNVLLITMALLAAAASSCGVRPETPLEAAAVQGDSAEIKKLLAGGTFNVNRGNSRGQTPLMHAVRNGTLDAVRELARAGADLNLQDTQNGWTPLIHAVHTRQLQAALLLVELGADVDGRTRGGTTPLMMASGYGETKLVEALLNKGANPYLESADGETALAEAVGGVSDIDDFTLGSCQTETVQALLTRAPDLKLKHNSVGRRARMFAKIGGCKNVLALIR